MTFECGLIRPIKCPTAKAEAYPQSCFSRLLVADYMRKVVLSDFLEESHVGLPGMLGIQWAGPIFQHGFPLLQSMGKDRTLDNRIRALSTAQTTWEKFVTVISWKMRTGHVGGHGVLVLQWAGSIFQREFPLLDLSEKSISRPLWITNWGYLEIWANNEVAQFFSLSFPILICLKMYD